MLGEAFGTSAAFGSAGAVSGCTVVTAGDVGGLADLGGDGGPFTAKLDGVGSGASCRPGVDDVVPVAIADGPSLSAKVRKRV